MKNLYPNIENDLRIFILISIVNCTAGRLFFILKRMQNYLRLQDKTKWLGHDNHRKWLNLIIRV